jgi:hypothetical protein
MFRLAGDGARAAPRRPFIATPHTHQERAMNFMMLSPARNPAAMRMHAPVHELALVDLVEPEPAAKADEDFSRCGWFDSSLELAAGLQVTEFVDRLPQGLPFERI